MSGKISLRDPVEEMIQSRDRGGRKAWRGLVCWSLAWLLASPAITQETSRGIRRVTVRDGAGRQVLLYERSHALLIGNSAYGRGW